ncbi:MoxR family ATPase [Pedobacter sp. HMWF019]|uniref:AAA family ATPase n=1 Tax=Pedobacter sp. HMWF019 TaxID=2056856 RepID=UPI000D374161|nr:MoxR family ATPase [Pedobacter sp. HMWF019]PTS98630.1 MoxR family ATPase [Pedobacter sp. HMWF019]
MSIKLFQGNTLTSKKESNKFHIDPYLPSPNLVKAVQLAQILQRPLLIKGEPGCGKSRLAEAIAAELHGKNFKDYYFEWNVKSTSKAQEGLYAIDHLKRLSDANMKWEADQNLEITLPKDISGNYLSKGNYIELGELGKAFLATNNLNTKIPPVVLIDEIDKADIDFPNDLLLELDRMEFKIAEAKDGEHGITIRANKDLKPLFIITSNDEKPLPAAFLRRCLFHYIDFSEIKLKEIVESKFPELAQNGNVIADAVDAFKYWRLKIEEKATSPKNISTSELLDWVKLIDHYHREEGIKFTKEEFPPYHQALLKDIDSIQLFAKPTTGPSFN